MKYLNVTQGYGTNTPNHQYKYPLDLGGQDTGIDSVYAPFDYIVRKVYPLGNTVWIESLEKVMYANGIVDYATVSFTHDNNVSNLKVGKTGKQDDHFYDEGTNNASANHIHIETGGGRFVSPGWEKFVYKGVDKWRIINAVKPESMLFLPEDTIIKNTGGYTWEKENNVLAGADAIAYLVRTLCARDASKEELEKHSNKYSFGKARDMIGGWGSAENVLANARAGKITKPQELFVLPLRSAYKAPATSSSDKVDKAVVVEYINKNLK